MRQREKENDRKTVRLSKVKLIDVSFLSENIE